MQSGPDTRGLFQFSCYGRLTARMRFDVSVRDRTSGLAGADGSGNRIFTTRVNER